MKSHFQMFGQVASSPGPSEGASLFGQNVPRTSTFVGLSGQSNPEPFHLRNDQPRYKTDVIMLTLVFPTNKELKISVSCWSTFTLDALRTALCEAFPIYHSSLVFYDAHGTRLIQMKDTSGNPIPFSIATTGKMFPIVARVEYVSPLQ